MNLILKMIFPAVLSITHACAMQSDSTFDSSIFKYNDPKNALGLHVSFIGENWSAEDVKEEHINFHINLFGNQEVMKGFADGQVRTAESVKLRITDSIENRFAKGKPHGLITVFDNTGDPFMHFVAGGGDRPGTSEIAYALMPSHWNKRFCSHVVGAYINDCAPEIYNVGRGIGLDPVANANIISTFQCFGGKPLEQIDATASPSNPGSWKVLQKTGFEAARCGLELTTDLQEPVVEIDFDQKNFLTLVDMEEELLKRYSPDADEPLIAGKRYRMVDPEGEIRTVSKHSRFDRLKYHFENKSFIK